MNFYEVAPADRGLKKHQTLTYSSHDELEPGALVSVAVRNRERNGVVVEKVKQPTYKTKPLSTISAPLVPVHMLELARWLADYYAVDLGAAIGLMIPPGVGKKRRAGAKTVDSSPQRVQKKLPRLNTDQKKALEIILKKPDTYVLHGVTGSGKTRIYIELAKQQREANKGAIILVPEIGLTSQMIFEFRQHFAEELYVVHSNQTEAQRHAQWLEIQAAKTPVVVGPRSALFSPIEQLGLLVVDEAHETAYKQDTAPKYQATRVAAKLRALTQATLVLGSATPSVEDYYLATQKKAPVIHIDKPVKAGFSSNVELVDMRQRDYFKRDQWLSDTLIHAIEQALQNGTQTILFHNRRGSSTSVICQDCGWIASCPNCELPLTHHSDWAKLVCHICNYREDLVSACPSCKSTDLVYRGAGTKEILRLTQKLFPSATIERFDSDVTKKAERLESRYAELAAGSADIIIGTQMIAKGLDLPNVSTVGVVLADTALYLPDFSSNERTYQLLTQVIGRSGRHQNGEVVIQSYNPDNPAIRFAINKNWKEFYEAEITDRKLTNYPPFAFLLKLVHESKNEQTAQADAERFAKLLRDRISDVEVLGPSPAFHHKTRTGWRWQIVVKSQNRAKLVHIARHVPAKWQFELDPINLL